MFKQQDELNNDHTMIKHLINKMGGEMCILNQLGEELDVYFGVQT